MVWDLKIEDLEVSAVAGEASQWNWRAPQWNWHASQSEGGAPDCFDNDVKTHAPFDAISLGKRFGLSSAELV